MRSFGRNSGVVTRRLRHAGPKAIDAIACCPPLISWADPRIVARCQAGLPLTWYLFQIPKSYSYLPIILACIVGLGKRLPRHGFYLGIVQAHRSLEKEKGKGDVRYTVIHIDWMTVTKVLGRIDDQLTMLIFEDFAVTFR